MTSARKLGSKGKKMPWWLRKPDKGQKLNLGWSDPQWEGLRTAAEKNKKLRRSARLAEKLLEFQRKKGPDVWTARDEGGRRTLLQGGAFETKRRKH